MTMPEFRLMTNDQLNLLFLNRLRTRLNLPAGDMATRIVLTLTCDKRPTVDVTTRAGTALRREHFRADGRIAPADDDGNPCWCSDGVDTDAADAADAATRPPVGPLPDRATMQRLQLGLDDILLVSVPGSVREDTAKRLGEHIARSVGIAAQRVLVLGDGIEIGALSPGGGRNDASAQGAPATKTLEEIIERVLRRIAPAVVTVRQGWQAGAVSPAGIVAPLGQPEPPRAFGRAIVSHGDHSFVIAALRDMPVGARIERRESGWECVMPDEQPTSAKPAVIGIDCATGADMTAIQRLQN